MPDATVICIDNSEWMRNGDTVPTRFEAQNEAVSLISTNKIDSNPEATVGVITMAGRTPKVLVTPVGDPSKIISALATVKIEGKIDILNTLQIAQLALKHRQNKSQRQRILLFVGSPIPAEQSELVKIGKRLKKNNIAVDIVNFGETIENTEKLEAFFNAVRNNENSSLIPVPNGPHNLADYLVSSRAIFGGEDGDSGVGGGDAYGVDANMDPELATVLRMSLEEEAARQRAEAQGGASAAGESKTETPSGADVFDDDMMIDDPELAEAMRLSLAAAESDAVAEKAAATESAPDTKKEEPSADIMDEDEDDEDLRLAMAMSMTPADEPETTNTKASETQSQVYDALSDPNFVDSIFDGIEGLDKDDPLIKSALEDLQKKDDKSDKN